MPHHCLGCIWSRRDKKENKHLAPTIRATISQFNTLTKCVASTVLGGKELKTQQRAKVIEKWINIAHVIVFLKIFVVFSRCRRLRHLCVERGLRVWLQGSQMTICKGLLGFCCCYCSSKVRRKIAFLNLGAYFSSLKKIGPLHTSFFSGDCSLLCLQSKTTICFSPYFHQLSVLPMFSK